MSLRGSRVGVTSALGVVQPGDQDGQLDLDQALVLLGGSCPEGVGLVQVVQTSGRDLDIAARDAAGSLRLPTSDVLAERSRERQELIRHRVHTELDGLDLAVQHPVVAEGETDRFEHRHVDARLVALASEPTDREALFQLDATFRGGCREAVEEQEEKLCEDFSRIRFVCLVHQNVSFVWKEPCPKALQCDEGRFRTAKCI